MRSTRLWNCCEPSSRPWIQARSDVILTRCPSRRLLRGDSLTFPTSQPRHKLVLFVADDSTLSWTVPAWRPLAGSRACCLVNCPRNPSGVTHPANHPFWHWSSLCCLLVIVEMRGRWCKLTSRNHHWPAELLCSYSMSEPAPLCLRSGSLLRPGRFDRL